MATNPWVNCKMAVSNPRVSTVVSSITAAMAWILLTSNRAVTKRDVSKQVSSKKLDLKKRVDQTAEQEERWQRI